MIQDVRVTGSYIDLQYNDDYTVHPNRAQFLHPIQQERDATHCDIILPHVEAKKGDQRTGWQFKSQILD